MRACRIQIFAGETPPVLVRKAQRSAELRAASYVRAHSFGKYPSDRSEFARRRHMQMTADDAWEQMEQGLQASGEGKGLLFFPVIATQGSIDDTLVSNGIHVNIPHESGKTEYVVGTLDVTIGLKLPAEELIGKSPKDPTLAIVERAYLSNVCVLPEVRRQGVAHQILEHACSYAYDMGARHMYVHVVEENDAARALYENKCGFAVEQIENASMARSLNRPRRILLHKAL